MTNFNYEREYSNWEKAERKKYKKGLVFGVVLFIILTIVFLA